MGSVMKYFPKKLLGHEILRCMVSWATNFFFEKFVKLSTFPSPPPPPPAPAYLMYAPLPKDFQLDFKIPFALVSRIINVHSLT